MSAPTPRDELASAYLDGEATSDERALVEADAPLLARVEELRAVRRTLATPVAARPDAAVDAAIAAALTAMPSGDDITGGPAPVPMRSGSSRRRGRIALAIVGAAAAAAVVVSVVTLRPSDDSVQSASRTATAVGHSETASGADQAGGGATIAAAATTAGPAPTAASPAATFVPGAAAPATAAATTATSGTRSLGAVDDADGLRAALASIPPTDLSAASASAADTGCAMADATLAATAVWQGTAADVFIDQDNVAHVVSQSTCSILVTVPLS